MTTMSSGACFTKWEYTEEIERRKTRPGVDGGSNIKEKATITYKTLYMMG